jgi:hypothetical protein
MKNVNQRRQYSNIKPFNDCCATALHVAKERYVESLGATIRTGGEWDFIITNPEPKIDKNTRRMIRKASRINNSKEGRAPTGQTQ